MEGNPEAGQFSLALVHLPLDIAHNFLNRAVANTFGSTAEFTPHTNTF